MTPLSYSGVITNDVYRDSSKVQVPNIKKILQIKKA